MFRKALSLSTLCAVLCSSEVLFAQVTTATLSGTIKDDTGAVLPGVTVTVKNLETGITRTEISDDQGRYQFPQLSLGNYEVQAALSGFQSGLRTGIKLTVGRQAVVDFTLKVGEISERVEVTGEAPLVETTTSAISGLVDDQVIRDLPLSGRSFTQLAALQLGVTISKYSGSGGGTGLQQGKSQKYSMAGARPHQSSFLIDGTDVNDMFNNTPGSVAGVFLGVEAIREFKTIVSNFTAEVGRSSGGVVSAVTKSGTNELHGSIFEFLRNSALDAKNFFDELGKPIPPFKRNQFGFAVGGPIRKNKAFFFATYEGLRERLSPPLLATVPSRAAREGLLPLERVSVHPAIRPYLDLYPLPNGRDFGDGTAELSGPGKRPIDEDYLAVRIDHQFSEKHSFFGRYTLDTADLTSLDNVRIFQSVQETRNQYLTLEEMWIARANFLNTLRFGFNRAFANDVFESLVDIPPSLDLSPVLPFGTSGTLAPGSGITALGRSVAPQMYAYNLFELTDDVTYTRGSHSLKMGVNPKWIQFNHRLWFFGSGGLTFPTLRDFLRGDPSSFTAVLAGSDPSKAWRQIYIGGYVQEDWRASPTLTLNLGLRYELMTGPEERTGRAANYDDDLGLQYRFGNPLFPTISKNGFQPRLGFAWDPWGTGKASIRGGFGYFQDQPFPVYWFVQSYLIQPFLIRVTDNRPQFPNSFEKLARISPIFAPDSSSYTKIPYMMQYNLSFQQQITADTVLNIGYSGSRGVSLVAGRDYNQLRIPQILPDGTKFYPPGAPLVMPHLDRYRRSTTDHNSWYSAMLLGLTRRYSNGLRFQASYTLGRSIDNGSGFNSSEFDNTSLPVDPFDLKREKGLSNFHTQHNLVMSYTYDLPFGPNQPFGSGLRGVAGKLIGGWQMNGIVSIASGTPFTVEGGNCRCDRTGRSGGSANLVAGRSNNPVLGGPDRYFDPLAFEAPSVGFLGNIGRNTVLGTGLATFDFSLVKQTALGRREGLNLQFKAEFFNLLNRPNFGLPARGVFTGGGIRVGAAGRIRTTITTARQIQFGLKLVF